MNFESETSRYDELVEELSTGSIPAKYDPSEFKSLVARILREVGPAIAKATLDASKDGGEKSLKKLWSRISQWEVVQEQFVQASRQMDSMAVLFVRSKFENNSIIGTGTLRASLEAELKRMKVASALSAPNEEVRRVIESILAVANGD
ncbi:MAG: hypothetical protein ACE5IO_04045 [Thermoplasmata archaeon]